MPKQTRTTVINQDFTASYDQTVPIVDGSLQTLTDADENIYLSFFTDSLLWSCGYNNPIINRNVNTFVRQHQEQNKVIDSKSLLNTIAKQLHRQMPDKLANINFASRSLYPEILDTLLNQRHKTRFFCLEKNPALFPAHYHDKIVTLMEIMDDDFQFNDCKVENALFPEMGAVKGILKKYKNTTAGFLLSPILFTNASVCKKELMEGLVSLLKKYKIPIIWDDSLSGFHRLGPTFSFKLFGCQPDVLIYNSKLYNDRSIHLIATSKKITRLLPDSVNNAVIKEDIPNFIMLKEILSFMDSSDFEKNTAVLSNRIQGKFRALQSSSMKRFIIKGKGLYYFIALKSEDECSRCIAFMQKKGILVKRFSIHPQCILISPPLVITQKNVDELIDGFRQFLRSNP